MYASTASMIPVIMLLAVSAVRLIPAFGSIAMSSTAIRSKIPAFDFVSKEISELENTNIILDQGKEEKIKFFKDIYIKKVNFKYPNTNTYSIIDFNLLINSGKKIGFIGNSGAGKSTFVNLLLGLFQPTEGKILIDGKDISNLSPQDRVKQGISFVPQTRNVFTGLSVRENLEMGAFLRKEGLEKVIEEIYQLFPILKEKQSQLVGELSGGQRQQVALGRALMINPSVLMLDEPTAGVSPIVMDELFNHILKVKQTNVAIIMVEQNAKQALSISDRGYVLVTGENKFSGTGDELLNDPEVRRSFLGA